jgi:dihydroorotate dehydrogenase (fumarate)
MDLSTKYLGLKLSHPFIAGAGPLPDTLDGAKRLEDAGAAAIVMRSLFEEQFEAHVNPIPRSSESPSETFVMGTNQYLEQLRKIKESLNIPIFASLNGHAPGKWLDHAGLIEQTSADALELNVYQVAPNVGESAASIEQNVIEMVREIKKAVKIPLAVKLSPFYTSLANLAHNIEKAGANGIVLFNRFFDVDIDVEKGEIYTHRQLSESKELLLRLRWLAILSDSLDSTTLAVTGGVHSAMDAIKTIICGASAIQMVSALLKHGAEHLSTVHQEMIRWMQEKGYESLEQVHSSMNIIHTRADYIQLLQTWKWA